MQLNITFESDNKNIQIALHAEINKILVKIGGLVLQGKLDGTLYDSGGEIIASYNWTR